jgi:hypothetical protein
VKQKARERLAALVDPAIGVLLYAMGKKAKHLQVAFQAARDVLDRNNLSGKQKFQLEGDVTLSAAETLRLRFAALEIQKELPAADEAPDGAEA